MESLSVYYVYLRVTKGHNSIPSWCSATKPGVSHSHMQVHKSRKKVTISSQAPSVISPKGLPEVVLNLNIILPQNLI